MPAPPTEPYPEWSLSDDNAGKYDFGSKVSYKENGVTSGYRANSLYVKGRVDPPSTNAGWTYDKYYALEWSPSRKYKIGDKVWYEVGDSTKSSQYYIYIASPRYFEGTAPPNEEEDLDGIRTWELYSESNGIVGTTFTIPMRKKSGHLGSVNSKNGKIDEGADTYNGDKIAPDEFPYVITGGGENAGYIPSKERITSVFEGGPYDERVYEFWNYDSNGARKSHKKRGIHRAQVVKSGNSGLSTEYSSIAERQWVFTHYGYTTGYLYGGYYPFRQDSNNDLPPTQYGFRESYGFSVEMWQNAPESEIELVTKNINLTQQNPSNWSGINYYGRFEFNPYISSSGAFGGDVHPETGVEQQAYGGKLEAFAFMNCPTFHARQVTFYLMVMETSYYWKQGETTFVDPNTGVSTTVTWYMQTYNPTMYSTKTLTFNTSDSSYKFDDGTWKIGQMFFSAGPRTSISVSMIGHSFT